jgi:hypothetical protein
LAFYDVNVKSKNYYLHAESEGMREREERKRV